MDVYIYARAPTFLEEWINPCISSSMFLGTAAGSQERLFVTSLFVSGRRSRPLIVSDSYIFAVNDF